MEEQDDHFIRQKAVEETYMQEIHRLWVQFTILLFAVVLLSVGGLTANSIALLAQSAYYMSEVIGLSFSMLALKFQSDRLESFGRVASIILLFASMLFAVVIASHRIMHPKPVFTRIVAQCSLVAFLLIILINKWVRRKSDHLNHFGGYWS